MKLGWQLKEEAPLFIIVLVIVAGLMWNTGKTPELSFGTGFLVAAVITSLEVMIDAAKEKGNKPPAKKKTSKKKKTTKKKKTSKKKKK